MAELIIHKGTFPSRVRRFCTEELKLKPFARYVSRFGEKVVWTGERREESKSRSLLPQSEYKKMYRCQVYRPILEWSVGDVWAELARAGINPHPLYDLGASRVGCWPCVNATKAELRLVARLTPERVSEIRDLEIAIGQTMFVRDRRSEARRVGGPSVVPRAIDEHLAWAGKDSTWLTDKAVNSGSCNDGDLATKRDRSLTVKNANKIRSETADVFDKDD